jgi:hypothetical protein
VKIIGNKQNFLLNGKRIAPLQQKDFPGHGSTNLYEDRSGFNCKLSLPNFLATKPCTTWLCRCRNPQMHFQDAKKYLLAFIADKHRLQKM